MKKVNKKRLGVLAMMLLLVIAIGATAGTTLAKYISSAKVDSKTATVAKWGWTLTADANKLFGEYYDGTGTIQTSKNSNSVVVKGKNDTREGGLVAPGTKGSMTLTLNGYAEVNTILTIDVNAFKTVSLTAKGDDNCEIIYYPLSWTVSHKYGNSNSEQSEGSEPSEYDAETLAAAIEEEIKNALDIESGNKSDLGIEVGLDEKENNSIVVLFIPANTRITSLELTIGWEWNFDNPELIIGDDDCASCEKVCSCSLIAEEECTCECEECKSNESCESCTECNDDSCKQVCVCENCLCGLTGNEADTILGYFAYGNENSSLNNSNKYDQNGDLIDFSKYEAQTEVQFGLVATFEQTQATSLDKFLTPED